MKTKTSLFTAVMKSKKTGEIVLYDSIGKNFMGDGITAKMFMQDLNKLSGAETINLRINSPGGSVDDANAIYNMLINHGAVINVVIDGIAASAASLVAMAGDTIHMPENAMIMIHDPMSFVFGNAESMKKMVSMLEKRKGGLVDIYHRKSGSDKEKISKMMTDETWMTAADAKEAGFADTVGDDVQMTMTFDPKVFQMFQNVPPALMSLLGVSADLEEEEKPVMTTEKPQVTMSQEDLAKLIADQVAVTMKAQNEAQSKVRNEQKKVSAKTTLMTLINTHKLLPAAVEMLAGQLSDDGANVDALMELGKSMAPQTLTTESIPNVATVVVAGKVEDFKVEKSDIPLNQVPASFVINKYAQDVLMKATPTLKYAEAVFKAEKDPVVLKAIDALK